MKELPEEKKNGDSIDDIKKKGTWKIPKNKYFERNFNANGNVQIMALFFLFFLNNV